MAMQMKKALLSSTLLSRHVRLIPRGLAGFPGVDGQYQDSSKQNSSNLSIDLNKNSKLRAILISIDVLTGANELLDKKSHISATKEVRDAAHDASVANNSVKKNTYDISKEVKGVTDNTAKYMDKLKSKLNGRNLPAKEDASGSGGGGSGARRGDSEFLSVGRAASAHVEAEKAKKQGAWMLVTGMGALLEYCSHRTMQIALLPTFATQQGLMDQFVASVDFTFDHVQSQWSPTSKPFVASQLSFQEKRGHISQAGAAMETILKAAAFRGCEPKQVLMVTNDDMLLAAAKDAGFFTVKYRTPTGLYGQVTTDFNATSAVEIQDALEELNGVAMRGSAFAHRSS